MLNIKKIKFAILGILFVSSFFIWSAYFSLGSGSSLKVTFFDVGQGDSVLIQPPNQSKIIIDGGPDNSVLGKIGRYLPFYGRAIDVLIITHMDSDHLSGAVEIIKKYDVGLVVINGKDCSTFLCKEFENVVKEKNIKVVAAEKGQEIDLGASAKIDVLMPQKQSADTLNKEGDNNSSIILKLSFGKDSFLFTGDAEDKEEMDLLQGYPNLTAEVLKVGHHGSKNSTNGLFLDKIKPIFSVISVGAKNKYGHPSNEVLDKLEKIGSKVLRTDLAGDIEFISNGEGVVLAN